MINPNTFNRDALHDFYYEVVKHPRISAKKYGYTVRDIKLVANFCFNKYIMLILREEQHNESAETYRKICNNIYNRLPKQFKWDDKR